MSANIRSLRNLNPLTEVIGASRDDLLSGDAVFLESVDVATTYIWTLAYAPEDSDQDPSSAVFLAPEGDTSKTANFIVDHTGSYLIRLITDIGLVTESTQFVRLRAVTEFGNFKLVAAGERKDATAVIPVDVDPVGWADDQNFNIKKLGELVARNSASGRIFYVDSNRGVDYANAQNDPDFSRGYADFFSINAAIAAAQASAVIPSSDNPFLIAVRPGLYVEDLTLVPYVYVLAESTIRTISEPVHPTGRGVLVRAENLGGTGTHSATTGAPNQIIAIVGVTLENVSNATTQATLEISGPGATYLADCYAVQRASAPSVGPAVHVDGSSVWMDSVQILNYADPTTSPLTPALLVDGVGADVMICRTFVYGPVCADVNPGSVDGVKFRAEFSRLQGVSLDAAAYGVRSVATETVFKYSTVEVEDPPERHLLINPLQLVRAGLCVVRIAFSAVREVIFDTTNITSPRLLLESSRVGDVTVLPAETDLVPGYVEADTGSFSINYDIDKVIGNPITSRNVQDALDEIVLGGVIGVNEYDNGLIKNVLEAVDSFTIPVLQQYLPYNEFIVDGTLVVDGELVVLGDNDQVTFVTTSDGSATAVRTLATAPGQVFRVEADVVGSSASDFAAFSMSVLAKSLGGVVTFGAGGVTPGPSDANGTPWSATMTPSGPDVLVEVTGAAATTINWRCRLTYERVSI